MKLPLFGVSALGMTIALMLSACASPPAVPPSRVQATSALDLPLGRPHAVEVSQGLAYLAHGQAGLVVVDLARKQVLARVPTGLPGPASPGREWVHEFAGEATAISLAGNSAFVLVQRKGYDVQRSQLVQYDIQQPAQPRERARHLLQGTAQAILAQSPQRCWVLRQLGGTYPPNSNDFLTLFDFQESGRVQRVGGLNSPEKGLLGSSLARVGEHQLRVQSTSSKAFLCSWNPPEKPSWLGPTEASTVPANGPELNATGLRPSPQAEWLRTGSNRLPGWSYHQGQDLVFGEGLQVYRQGKLESSLLPEIPVDDVQTQGKDRLVATPRGVFRLTGSGDPVLLREGPCRRLAVAGETLWGADEQRLFQVGGGSLDIAGIEAIAVHSSGRWLALACGRKGVELVAIGQDGQLRSAARFFDRGRGRMAVRDLVIDGDDLWLADADNGLYQLRVDDPQQPRLTHFVSCPNPLQLALGSDALYAACGIYGLTRVGRKNLEEPRLFPEAPCFAVADLGAGQVRVQTQQGLQTLSPVGGEPIPQWRLQTTLPVPMGIPRRLSLSGDGSKVWVANDEGWNVIEVDLTDPARPQLGRLRATGGFARSVAWSPQWLAATNHRGLQLFTHSQTEPERVWWLPKTGHLLWAGRQLWVECNQQLLGWEFSSSGGATPLGTLPLSRALSGRPDGLLVGCDPEALAIYQGKKLLARHPRTSVGAACTTDSEVFFSDSQGIHCISLAQPERLKVSAEGPQEPVLAMDVQGPHLVTAGAHLSLWDRQSLQLRARIPAPKGAGTYGGGPRFVDVRIVERQSGSWVVALDAYHGLRIYRLEGLREAAQFATQGGDYTGLAVEGDQLFVANNWGGLYQVVQGQAKPLDGFPPVGATGPLLQDGRLFWQGNVDRTLYVGGSQPLKLLGHWPLPEGGRLGDTRRFGATFPALRGNTLYLPGFARVLDVSDPTRPRVLGQCPEAGFHNDSCQLTELEGRPHLVLSGAEALKVVDVSRPESPQLVGSLEGDYLGGYYFGRGLAIRGTLALVCNRAQLNLIDLSNPRRPTLLSSLELFGNPCDLALRGDLAYVSCYYGGLQVVNFRDPRKPFRLTRFQQGSYQDGPSWDNQVAYQSLAFQGDSLWVCEYYSGLQRWHLSP